MEEHFMSKHEPGLTNLTHLTLSAKQKKLRRGVINSDVALIREALREDSKIIDSNIGGGSHYVGFRAIHWAAANGSLTAIRELKAHNVDLTRRAGASWVKSLAEPRKFELPLETAAYYLWDDKHQQRGEVLRELRLDPQDIASREELLYLGAITNDITYLAAAVERGANVNQNLGNYKDTKFTALHWAAKYNSQEAMQWLIKNGANPAVITGAGLTYDQVLEEYQAPEQKLSPVGWVAAHAVNGVGLFTLGKRDCGRIGKNISQTIAKVSDFYQRLPEPIKERIPAPVRGAAQAFSLVSDPLCNQETLTFRH